MRYIVAVLSAAMSGAPSDRFLVIDTNLAGSVQTVAIVRTSGAATALAANLNANPI